MKYRNKEIGIPTVEIIKEYCKMQGFAFNPIDCYAYFKAKDWKTKIGRGFQSVETMCNVYNGQFVYHNRNKSEKVEFKPLSYEKSPYKEQLLDRRWRMFREFAIYARGGKCENCGSKKKLVIHHPRYFSGYNAWDYSVRDVVCLCDTCHAKVHGKL